MPSGLPLSPVRILKPCLERGSSTTSILFLHFSISSTSSSSYMTKSKHFSFHRHEKEITFHHPRYSRKPQRRWQMRKKSKESRWMKSQKERKAGLCMPLTITFPVFFTLSYVMVLMVKDAEKSLQLLQFLISKKTEKRIIINKSFKILWIRNG